jgi:outer membrane protein TolC
MKMWFLCGLGSVICGLAMANVAVADPANKESVPPIPLERVLDLTLKNSFKIALANEQFEAAVRALHDAKKRRLPRVGVQGWFSGDLFEVGEWGDQNLGSYLTLDWDFYQDGAIMQAIAQSWANLKSAQYTRRQTVLELIYGATSLFYDALKARRQIESGNQTLAVDEMRLKIVRAEFEQGRRTQFELVDAEGRVLDSRLSLTRAQQALAKVTMGLRQLTRDDAIESIEDLPRGITWQLDFPVEHAVRTALARQPNVLIARANVELATMGVKYARLKRLPSVRFLTGTDYAFAPLARPEDFGFRVGVIVSYPLYDAGDRASRIEDARSALKRAEIQLWQAQDQMKEEVTDSYASVSNQLTLLELAEKGHEKVKTEFEIAKKRYEERKIDELQMAEIRSRYTQSVERVESYRLDALLARAKLLKSVGVSSLDEIRAYCRKESKEKK